MVSPCPGGGGVGRCCVKPSDPVEAGSSCAPVVKGFLLRCCQIAFVCMVLSLFTLHTLQTPAFQTHWPCEMFALLRSAVVCICVYDAVALWGKCQAVGKPLVFFSTPHDSIKNIADHILNHLLGYFSYLWNSFGTSEVMLSTPITGSLSINFPPALWCSSAHSDVCQLFSTHQLFSWPSSVAAGHQFVDKSPFPNNSSRSISQAQNALRND